MKIKFFYENAIFEHKNEHNFFSKKDFKNLIAESCSTLNFTSRTSFRALLRILKNFQISLIFWPPGMSVFDIYRNKSFLLEKRINSRSHTIENVLCHTYRSILVQIGCSNKKLEPLLQHFQTVGNPASKSAFLEQKKRHNFFSTEQLLIRFKIYHIISA